MGIGPGNGTCFSQYSFATTGALSDNRTSMAWAAPPKCAISRYRRGVGAEASLPRRRGDGSHPCIPGGIAARVTGLADRSARFMKEAFHMIRMILVAVGVAVLPTNSVLAQSNCDQIREAVATYGYEAARAHALAHYGEAALIEGDKCLTDLPVTEVRPTEPLPTKTSATKTQRTKTPPTKTSKTKTPQTKTAQTKTPPTKTSQTKTPQTKAPATK
jgi:hypothetical protein